MDAKQLKTLTEDQLKDEILWRKINLISYEIEPRQGQSKRERKIEYNNMHSVYRKYWNEAYRRGMVNFKATTNPLLRDK